MQHTSLSLSALLKLNFIYLATLSHATPREMNVCKTASHASFDTCLIALIRRGRLHALIYTLNNTASSSSLAATTSQAIAASSPIFLQFATTTISCYMRLCVSITLAASLRTVTTKCRFHMVIDIRRAQF